MSAPRVVERIRPSHPTAPARHLNKREDTPFMSNKIKRRVMNAFIVSGAVGAIVGVVAIGNWLNELAGRKWG